MLCEKVPGSLNSGERRTREAESIRRDWEFVDVQIVSLGLRDWIISLFALQGDEVNRKLSEVR